MSKQKKQPIGCGCANIPISVIILMLGISGWWLSQENNRNAIAGLVSQVQAVAMPILQQIPISGNSPAPEQEVAKVDSPQPDSRTAIAPQPSITATPKATPTISNITKKPALAAVKTPQTPWESKAIRGIYFSRYYITNRASEQMIRQRVRHFRSQGFNTIIHGVWGNGCTMYNSQVMQEKFGFPSCPNKFRAKWLDWMIDEAHKQGMEVHAYFEKGIKIDKNSPIFDLAIARKWVVPGVDRTYAGVEHYVLDVEIPEVANFFKDISVEFVKKYSQIDAVQWDDYLGYHAELPGKVDRTAKLTNFVQQMIAGIKQANPNVSFDICHHNPYWAKRYFAADWANWDIDRAFIQVYNDANFKDELKYVKDVAGIAISEEQLKRLPELIKNKQIKSILVFPTSGKPEQTASQVKSLLAENQSETKTAN